MIWWKSTFGFFRMYSIRAYTFSSFKMLSTSGSTFFFFSSSFAFDSYSLESDEKCPDIV